MKTYTAREYLEAYEPGVLALARNTTAVLAEFTAQATEVATQVGIASPLGRALAAARRYPEAVWLAVLS